jgi:hypothetical protein
MGRPPRALAAVASLLVLCGCPKSNDGGGGGAGASGADASGSSARAITADAAARAAAATAFDGGVLNVSGSPLAEVMKFVNPRGLPAYDGPTGSVEGTVTVLGPPAPDATGLSFARCPDAAAIYGKRFREGTARPDGTRPLADTIVAVTGYAGYFVPERNEAAKVSIVACGFDKRTVTMTFGQVLDVKNTSTEFWSPLLDPAPNAVIMMAAPRAPDPVRLYPKRPGRARLYDHDRPYAVSDLFVFFHPLHAVTDTAGHYRIDGLPVGKLKVNALHPAFEGESAVDLDVQANVVSKVDLVLRYVPTDGGTPDEDAGYRPKLR